MAPFDALNAVDGLAIASDESLVIGSDARLQNLATATGPKPMIVATDPDNHILQPLAL